MRCHRELRESVASLAIIVGSTRAPAIGQLPHSGVTGPVRTGREVRSHRASNPERPQAAIPLLLAPNFRWPPAGYGRSSRTCTRMWPTSTTPGSR